MKDDQDRSVVVTVTVTVLALPLSLLIGTIVIPGFAVDVLAAEGVGAEVGGWGGGDGFGGESGMALEVRAAGTGAGFEFPVGSGAFPERMGDDEPALGNDMINGISVVVAAAGSEDESFDATGTVSG